MLIDLNSGVTPGNINGMNKLDRAAIFAQQVLAVLG
jgi:hypothetical protein